MAGRRIKSDHPANGPDGAHWAKAGSVVTIDDDATADDLLKHPGFSEVGADEADTPAASLRDQPPPLTDGAASASLPGTVRGADGGTNAPEGTAAGEPLADPNAQDPRGVAAPGTPIVSTEATPVPEASGLAQSKTGNALDPDKSTTTKKK